MAGHRNLERPLGASYNRSCRRLRSSEDAGGVGDEVVSTLIHRRMPGLALRRSEKNQHHQFFLYVVEIMLHSCDHENNAAFAHLMAGFGNMAGIRKNSRYGFPPCARRFSNSVMLKKSANICRSPFSQSARQRHEILSPAQKHRWEMCTP